MRHCLLALIIMLVPMTIAGWLGWALLEDRGMSLMFALLVGVTFAPPLARVAQGADRASARTRQ
jgi:hypothetical protein